jgi:hypothetical protein
MTRRGAPPTSKMIVGVLAALFCAAPAGCPTSTRPPTKPVNPFRDIPDLERDGKAIDVALDIVPIGELEAGEVVRILVGGDGIDAVLVLIEDRSLEQAGTMIGAGPANEAFEFRAHSTQRHFVYVQFDVQRPQRLRKASISVRPGDPASRPPTSQVVLVEFEDGYLSEPGLFDPTDGVPEEREYLESVADLVADEIVDRLRVIFEGSPIEILAASDPIPVGRFSRLTFSPEQVLSPIQGGLDLALPPPDPARPECDVSVIFGEVLPRGVGVDLGNRTDDDDAVVYVGSFQGRGATCRTAATDSLNLMVLLLAQTGAHEIGHLVGLYHTEQIDIMNRAATLAFQRELGLGRGQVQIDTPSRDGISTVVLTSIVQDPEVYFRGVFGDGDEE